MNGVRSTMRERIRLLARPIRETRVRDRIGLSERLADTDVAWDGTPILRRCSRVTVLVESGA